MSIKKNLFVIFMMVMMVMVGGCESSKYGNDLSGEGASSYCSPAAENVGLN